jgi:TrmH family RNA methyltransferase
MIDIILMEPEREENVGSVARVMKNFGFSQLVLINPKCSHLGNKAQATASHAVDILQHAKMIGKHGLKKYDYLIATTAILGTDSNVIRLPLTPREAALLLRNTKAKIGLVFGRESSGLRNEEIELCDVVVTIPSSKKYPTMNLSHSVAIILYEIFSAASMEHVASHIRPASQKHKDILLGIINTVLNNTEFSTKEKRETQRKVWKRVVGKAMLSKKEALALMGFFKKMARKRG